MDNLIYGKSNLKRLVGLEVSDGSAEAFIQNEDGTVGSQFISNRYWILSHTNLDGKFFTSKEISIIDLGSNSMIEKNGQNLEAFGRTKTYLRFGILKRR
jgi:hypothetical protein